MSLFFRPKSDLGIVYDIGTSSVGAGLVKFNENSTPEITYTVREQMRVREKTDAKRLLSVVSDTLKKVHTRIHTEGLNQLKSSSNKNPQISSVFFMLSTPWSASETKVASIRKNEVFDLSETFVNNLLDEEERLFEKSLASESKLWKDKPVVIGKEVIQTTLNGYGVSNPFGRKVKEVDIAFVVSVAPHDVIEVIESLSARSHTHKEFRAFAFPIAIFSVIRDIFPDEENFIFMDIAGEITDLIVVSGGVPLEHASVPVGRNFIVRSVGRNIGEPPAVAFSTVISILSGAADEKATVKAREELNKAKSTWIENIRKAFTDISSRIAMPRKLFVMTHGEFVPLFVEALKTEVTSDWNIDGVSFSIELINEEQLKKHAVFSKTAHRDPFIALATSFVTNARLK